LEDGVAAYSAGQYQKDYVQAATFCVKAADQGYSSASLEQRLSAKQLADAKSRTLQRHPRANK
jgi:hypothetical protein